MGVTDWEIVTNYIDTVGTTLKTFSFSKPQDYVKITTKGNANITYTIGTQSGTLTPGQSIEVSEVISSFTLTATSGTQTIEVFAKEDGTEKEEKGVDLANKYSISRGNTMVLLGDSLTEFNSPTTSFGNLESYGFFNWANIFLKQAFFVVKNAGKSGDSTSQMLARIQTDVIAHRPNYCMFMGGINDIRGNISASNIIANIKKIYETLKSANIIIITSTITPDSSLNATQKTTRDIVNNWIRVNAQIYDLILVDFDTKISDINGNPNTNLTQDGLHYSPEGAWTCGNELYLSLKDKIKSVNLLSVRNGDSSVVNSNACMVGNNAGLATGYSLSGATKTTPVKIARTDGIAGEWQKFGNTSDAGAVNLQLDDVYGGFAAGADVCYGLCEVEIDNITTLKSLLWQLSAWSAGPSYINNVYALGHGGSSAFFINKGTWKGVIRSPNYSLPSNTVSLRLTLSLTGQCEIRVGRMEIRKVLSI